MNAHVVNQLVERLIRLVARAFYTDDAIVVLDALVRKKFIKDAEMGTVLCLHQKQVRKIIKELQRDKLVQEQSFDGDTYYYVDYKHFFDVVRYRVYLIKSSLAAREEKELLREMMRCTQCGDEYTTLEAQRLLNNHAGMVYVCGNTSCRAENSLKSVDNSEELKKVQCLKRKLGQQFDSKKNARDGMYDCLKELNRLPPGTIIPSNTPIDNVTEKRVLTGSSMTDDPMGDSMAAKRAGEDGENGQMGHMFPTNEWGQAIEVVLEDDGEDVDVDGMQEEEVGSSATKGMAATNGGQQQISGTWFI
jgi:transcription initiation factor TFIIE subunit alpha